LSKSARLNQQKRLGQKQPRRAVRVDEFSFAAFLPLQMATDDPTRGSDHLGVVGAATISVFFGVGFLFEKNRHLV